MYSDAVEPMYIVSQFTSQLLRGIEATPVNKLGFDEFECGLCHGVVVGTAPQTKGAMDAERFQ